MGHKKVAENFITYISSKESRGPIFYSYLPDSVMDTIVGLRSWLIDNLGIIPRNFNVPYTVAASGAAYWGANLAVFKWLDEKVFSKVFGFLRRDPHP